MYQFSILELNNFCYNCLEFNPNLFLSFFVLSFYHKLYIIDLPRLTLIRLEKLKNFLFLGKINPIYLICK